MKSLPWRAFLAAALALAASGSQAQQREPHAGYLYPAGGRAGTTFEAALGGQYLDGASALNVSGGGVRVEVIRHYKMLTQQQINGLRNGFERMQALEEAAKTDPSKKREAEAVRARLEETLRGAGIDDFSFRGVMAYRKKYSDPKRQVNPAISEYVTLKITIAPDAAVGDREVRLRTDQGLTNPLRFQVGSIAEIAEKEPNERTPETAVGQPLPLVFNGQIMPGDVDRFRFTAKKGDRLVAAAAARALIPYLADAVPGWFQATLGLFDASGKEIAYADDNRFDPDPVLYCEIPADGDYVVEIKDSIYRGREDFVYRITVGQVPYLGGLFPLGGRAGTAVTVAAAGWNLPQPTLTVNAAPEAGVQRVSDDQAGRFSNCLPFASDTLPECMESEPQNDRRPAQRVDPPVTINGRIDRPGDRDVFAFAARRGETLVAEVLARRLNSPMDSAIRIFDADGRQLAVNDDHDDKGAGLVTHQADSRLEFAAPADGTYYLEVEDAQGKGGPAYAYRCRLGPRQPDFALRVVPSSLNVRAGSTIPVTVYALRKDGYDGPIALALKDAPPGFTLAGGGVPGGQEKVRLTLTAPDDPTEKAVRLRVEGAAAIGGGDVRHEATPADDMMQAFFYRHLVPAEALLATVYGRNWRLGQAVRLDSPVPVRIPAGGTAVLRVSSPVRSWRANFHLELNEPPEGIEIGKVSASQDGWTLELNADASKIKPGTKGTLIVEAFNERQGESRPGQPKAGAQRFPVGFLPAIPFEIVAGKS